MTTSWVLATLLGSFTPGATPSPSTTTPEPAGVEAVHPEKPGDAERKRFIAGASMLGVGMALEIATGVLTHVSLTYDCDEDDILDCEVGSIRERVGMFSGGVSLSVASGVLSGLGSGFTTRYIRGSGTSLGDPQLRRIFTGVGAASLSLGLAQVVVGGALTGVGVARALEDVPETDGTSEGDEAQRRAIKDRLGDLSLARSGMALVLTAPALIAAGAAMILRRPDDTRLGTLELSPVIGRGFQGLSLSGRF